MAAATPGAAPAAPYVVEAMPSPESVAVLILSTMGWLVVLLGLLRLLRWGKKQLPRSAPGWRWPATMVFVVFALSAFWLAARVFVLLVAGVYLLVVFILKIF